jgi:hypothetical protein
MRKFFKKRQSRKIVNKAIVIWLEELDDLITLIQHDIEILHNDLQDLTDFVEDRLD